MDKKGVELPSSTLVIILILILFLVVIIGVYAVWGGQTYELVDAFFRLFRR